MEREDSLESNESFESDDVSFSALKFLCKGFNKRYYDSLHLGVSMI